MDGVRNVELAGFWRREEMVVREGVDLTSTVDSGQNPEFARLF